MIEVQREAVGTQLLDDETKSFTFEVLLGQGYPFTNPQVLCHSKFTNELLILNDGRDLFKEIVGPQVW